MTMTEHSFYFPTSGFGTTFPLFLRMQSKQPKATANTLYPGLPNYIGETKGWFTLLHHSDHLIEWSDNVMKRIEYINKKKPEHERKTRLRHIVYVPNSLVPDELQKAWAARDKAWAACQKASAAYGKAWAACGKAWAARDKASAAYGKAWAAYQKAWAACDKAWAAYGKAWAAYQKAWAAYENDKNVLAYLHKHVENCKWNGKEIVFPSSR